MAPSADHTGPAKNSHITPGAINSFDSLRQQPVSPPIAADPSAYWTGTYALPGWVWRLAGQTVAASSAVWPFLVNSSSCSGGSTYWCQSQDGFPAETGFFELYGKEYLPCVPTSDVVSRAATIALAAVD